MTRLLRGRLGSGLGSGLGFAVGVPAGGCWGGSGGGRALLGVGVVTDAAVLSEEFGVGLGACAQEPGSRVGLVYSCSKKWGSERSGESPLKTCFSE